MEDKEYKYKRLNIKNGDIINDYHINYLQDAISKISSESKEFKNSLANILKGKGVDASSTDSFKNLLSKVNSLQNIPERTHKVDWPDISQNIESGHIRLLVQTGTEITFWLKPSKSANFVINWKEGSTDKIYVPVDGAVVKKNLNDTGLTTIDISLDTEDCRIEVFKSQTANSRKNILWFCSKDIIFTNGSAMFSGGTDTTGYACENLKYIDFIGGGITGSIESFARDCINLERVTGDLNPNGYHATAAFYNCQNLKDLPILNLTGVKNINYLFYNCRTITNFPYYINNNGTITSAFNTFYNCVKLQNFIEGQEFDFSKASDQYQCFQNCSNLITSPKIKFGSGSAEKFYSDCTSLRNIQDNFDLNTVTNASSFFYNCSNLIDGPSDFYAPQATRITSLFEKCSNLQHVPESLTFSKAIYANYLFRECFKLKNAPNTINLPAATEIKEMFKNCNTLTNPPVTINAESAKTADSLFRDCNLLITAPTTIKLSVAKEILNMFYNCTSLTKGPDTLEAPVAENASTLFYNCKSLTKAGNKFEIGNKCPGSCNFTGFFQLCSSLKTLPTEGDMHTGKIYAAFFQESGNVEYESLKTFCNRGLSFPEATSLNTFFNDCSNIKKISSINAPKCTTATALFQNTQNLMYLEDIILTSCTSLSAAFNRSGQSLIDIGKIDISSNSNNNLDFATLRKIRRLTLVGLRMDFALNNATELTSIRLENPNEHFIGNLQFNSCNLSKEALESLLEDLPNVNSRANKPSIQIKNNPGTSGCDTSVAVNNGWTVTK